MPTAGALGAGTTVALVDGPTNPRLIDEHANGLVALGRAHPLGTPVPTCGDWNLGDLIWHLFEVEHFWCHVIGGRPDATPASYERPVRPNDDAALPDWLEAASHELVTLLDAADPAEPAWSWSEADRSVGFTVRRQTHEAIVHHLDGVLAVGGSPDDVRVDPSVAADGIAELVDVMLTGVPPWAEYHPSTDTVRLELPGLDRQWDLEFGRVTGTSPDTGIAHDLVAFDRRHDVELPDATVAGAPLDLLLWLWGRIGLDRVAVTGDQTYPARLREAIVDATA